MAAPESHIITCFIVFGLNTFILFLATLFLILKRTSLMAKAKSTMFFHFVTFGCFIMIGSQFFDLYTLPDWKHPAAGYLYHWGLSLIHVALAVRQWRLITLHKKTLNCPLVTCKWNDPTTIRRRGFGWSFIRIFICVIFPNIYIPLGYILRDSFVVSDLLCVIYSGICIALNITVSVWLVCIRQKLSYEDFDESISLMIATIFSVIQFATDVSLWFGLVSPGGIQWYILKFVANVFLIDVIFAVTSGSSLYVICKRKNNLSRRGPVTGHVVANPVSLKRLQHLADVEDPIEVAAEKAPIAPSLQHSPSHPSPSLNAEASV